MKTIGSSAVLLVGSFILHFIGLGLSQSFGIIYSIPLFNIAPFFVCRSSSHTVIKKKGDGASEEIYI
jgi:hypothetical protein